MTTPVREGETIEGSRTMRNRPYPVLKCSSSAEARALFFCHAKGLLHGFTVDRLA